MQVRLKHGNIRNAVFVKKSCIEFKNFIEKAVDHRDAGNYKEATYAAKNFEKTMKTGQNGVQGWRQHMQAVKQMQQRRKNKNIITSIVKTVMFCASSYIPLRVHSDEKENFIKLLQFRIDAGDEDFKKHFL